MWIFINFCFPFQMNTTRSIWSKTLNCCKLRRHPEIIFLCVTGVISFLPLLFYVVVRYCGPIRDLPNVLKRKLEKLWYFNVCNFIVITILLWFWSYKLKELKISCYIIEYIYLSHLPWILYFTESRFKQAILRSADRRIN